MVLCAPHIVLFHSSVTKLCWGDHGGGHPIAGSGNPHRSFTVRAHKSPSPHHSEKDNAALSRKKPHAKEISSRFLPSSSSSSTSTSQCTPSPLPISSSSGPKRSHSIDWRRPSAATQGDGAAPPWPPRPSAPPPGASLSPSRASPSSSRPVSPSPARKPSPDRRCLTRTLSRRDRLSENSKPFNHHQHWPAERAQQSNILLKRSLDSTLVCKKDPYRLAAAAVDGA